MLTCDVKLRILSLNSFSKPFITDKTVIKMATPSIRPAIDTLEIIDMNDKLYFENKSLYAIRRFIATLYQILNENEKDRE
tara:strand:+ start:45 stop:284 length:240 start_codon:yes stop_codon:yes gene_type:complete